LRYFVEETVQFLVVGGYAVMKHSEPYNTRDLHLWIAPHRANAERAYRSLARFGAPLGNVTVDDLVNPDIVYQLGVEPARIDVMSAVSVAAELVFAAAHRRQVHRHHVLAVGGSKTMSPVTSS
jgi:hypothetical protein